MKKTDTSKIYKRTPDRETTIRDLRSLAQMAVSPHIKETCMAAVELIEQGVKEDN